MKDLAGWKMSFDVIFKNEKFHWKQARGFHEKW